MRIDHPYMNLTGDHCLRGYDFLMLSDHDRLSDYAGLDTKLVLIPVNADRVVAIQQVGKRFAQVAACSIEVEVPTGATYVRFE